MMTDDTILDLEALSREVQRRLDAQGLAEAQADGRVAPAPDARTIRYYQTLGLLERPRIVDREARYGRRHVLQLVAVKALQAAGLSLAEIQSRLYGRSNAEIEALLTSLSEARKRRPVEVCPRKWREVAVEPGVRLMVEDGWSPRTSPAALEERIRAALAALQSGGAK